MCHMCVVMVGGRGGCGGGGASRWNPPNSTVAHSLFSPARWNLALRQEDAHDAAQMRLLRRAFKFGESLCLTVNAQIISGSGRWGI